MGAGGGSAPWALSENSDRRSGKNVCHEDAGKVDAGGASTETFVHDFWEEVYILEGSQWDGDQYFKKGNVCLPSSRHERHGPYRTEEGVVTFEVRYTR